MKLWICIFALLASDLMLAQDEFYDDDELTADELDIVLESFPKLTDSERHAIRSAFSELNGGSSSLSVQMIPNHRSARLSEVDLAMVAGGAP